MHLALVGLIVKSLLAAERYEPRHEQDREHKTHRESECQLYDADDFHVFSNEVMPSRYGFCDKAERVASSAFGGKAAEGKKRRFESKEDPPTVVFRSPDIAFRRCVSE